MSQTITAIYANGVLRPITPLDLPEWAQVEIEVKRVTALEIEQINERRRVIQALAEAGIIINLPLEPFPPSLLSLEERERLAKVLSVGKPLSEIIIEEHEGR